MVHLKGNAITVNGLAKNFGDVRALVDVSFEVRDGELFGFLGPNGAGKTTTINIITGLAKADGGTASVAGMDCVKHPKSAQYLMGVVPDESNLYPELSGYENLCFCGALYGMSRKDRASRADELLELFGLKEAAGRKFAGYSSGMKRKMTIAAGIIHNPPILFLDEPTTGIDVASARQIRRLIVELNRTGTTIFLTTHYIEEAERVCERVAFIVSGSVVEMDTVDNLMRQAQGRFTVEFVVEGEHSIFTQELVSALPESEWETVAGGIYRVSANSPVNIGPIVRFFENRGLEVAEARRVRPSLEDVFVRITGLDVEEMKKEKARGV